MSNKLKFAGHAIKCHYEGCEREGIIALNNTATMHCAKHAMIVTAMRKIEKYDRLINDGKIAIKTLEEKKEKLTNELNNLTNGEKQ
jgi:hypothetical protein